MAHDPLPVLVHEATQPPTMVIALLHGHGDEPAGLLDRFAQLVPDDITVVAPVGPVRTSGGEPAWFSSAPGDAPERSDDEGTLAEAVHRLAVTFGPGGASGAPPNVVFGYSQGAATALALTFGSAPDSSWRPSVVGTVAGWLPSDPDLSWDFSGAAAHTGALLIHGIDDEVVDPQLGRSATRLLERSGVQVDFLEVPGGHALGDNAIMRLLTQLGLNPRD